MSTVGIIAAVDPSWVMGLNGGMPWHYKEDFKRFKAVTMGSTLIMGRATWESLPKPLPGRRMIVLTRQTSPTSKHLAGSCEYYPNLDIAMLAAGSDQHGTNGDVWFVGGAEIYRAALPLVDVDLVDLTVVPAVEAALLSAESAKVTYFPHEGLAGYSLAGETPNEDDPRLRHRRYERIR